MAYFTIITATYNAAATLPQLLDSLATQSFKDFELIIQDGGSRDDTMSIIESYRERLPFISAVSEPDRGIYDAWNKALPRVQGKWVLFLGADDILATPEVLNESYALLQQCSLDIVFAAGSVTLVSNMGEPLIQLDPVVEKAEDLLRLGTMPVCHTTLFHNSLLFKKCTFDASFRIAGDYELLCRVWKPDSMISLPLVIAFMGISGVSNNPSSALRMRKEYLCIRWCYYRSYISLWREMFSLLKGMGISAFCFLVGKHKTAMLLDRFRVMRGLPSMWCQK